MMDYFKFAGMFGNETISNNSLFKYLIESSTRWQRSDIKITMKGTRKPS
jgi:hypothetical protein